MVKMKQMLLEEARDARFKWSSDEMAKDLACHGHFLRDFHTHSYDQDKLADLLNWQIAVQAVQEQQEADYAEGEH